MTFSSFYVLSAFISLCVPLVSAFWRLPCISPIVVERADPIVSPGKVANHVHAIMGGNGFAFTMDYSSTQASTCSSCTVKGDFSNYWVPALYYQYQNGSFKNVGQAGGATIYYEQRSGSGENLYAFPQGFRMVAGDPFKRQSGADFASQAVSYACLNYNAPATPETPNFPTTNCPDGLRTQVYFPSCWDGINLDSDDHKSHMSYPANAYNNGPCPSTHPKHLISIFFEVIWNVNDFRDMWYGNSQPFVWAQGDPTGYGLHGDFINGWDVNLLQSAVEQCTSDSGRVEDCSVFNLTSNSVAEGCVVSSEVDEPVTGILEALPGCNPIQSGPSEAIVHTGCGAISQLSAPAAYFTDLSSTLGWSYAGCGTDNYYKRSLQGGSESNSNMTNENCVEFCINNGFTVAGTEFSDECYCGDSIPSDGAPIAGVVGKCTMACAGNASENCGGSGAISLYQKCAGDTCTNVQFGPVAAPDSSTTATSFSTSSATSSVSRLARIAKHRRI